MHKRLYGKHNENNSETSPLLGATGGSEHSINSHTNIRTSNTASSAVLTTEDTHMKDWDASSIGHVHDMFVNKSTSASMNNYLEFSQSGDVSDITHQTTGAVHDMFVNKSTNASRNIYLEFSQSGDVSDITHQTTVVVDIEPHPMEPNQSGLDGAKQEIIVHDASLKEVHSPDTEDNKSANRSVDSSDKDENVISSLQASEN